MIDSLNRDIRAVAVSICSISRLSEIKTREGLVLLDKLYSCYHVFVCYVSFPDIAISLCVNLLPFLYEYPY